MGIGKIQMLKEKTDLTKGEVEDRIKNFRLKTGYVHGDNWRNYKAMPDHYKVQWVYNYHYKVYEVLTVFGELIMELPEVEL